MKSDANIDKAHFSLDFIPKELNLYDRIIEIRDRYKK